MRNPSATPTHRAPATTIVSCPDAFGRSPSRLTIAARALVRLDDHTGLARLPRPWGRPGPSPPAGAGGDQGAPKRAAGGWREFVATASHELRTPLASLEGMLELLRDDLGDERPDLEDARALVERA
ncbi:MAG TPA: histidine kinase dimerization/phospho-acceptor domain-containing protein, partial [Solirubrobacteraceae bacterium]|nr:histidine kinase dimerization/phospho-acceptor domain-containing protein [Solirubrobacteraceae bacterium]